MSINVSVLRAGRLPFETGLLVQQYIAQKYKTSKPHDFRNTLILTEHDPVYTIGIRTKGYTKNDEIRLRNLGAQFYKTNRGGLITFHGPGQLVVYPILNLKDFKPSMRWYVKEIESCVIDTCKMFNINATTTSDTGVWVNDKKICAIGIHGSRYITTHGLALNCNTDLTWFNHIVSCGIEGKGVTSISEEIKLAVNIDETIPKFLESFKNRFSCNIEEYSDNEKDTVMKKINTLYAI